MPNKRILLTSMAEAAAIMIGIAAFLSLLLSIICIVLWCLAHWSWWMFGIILAVIGYVGLVIGIYRDNYKQEVLNGRD